MLLRDGSRLKLRYTQLPGSLRIADDDLSAFLERVAADGIKAGEPEPDGTSDAAPKPRQSARVAQMNADLAAAGFSV